MRLDALVLVQRVQLRDRQRRRILHRRELIEIDMLHELWWQLDLQVVEQFKPRDELDRLDLDVCVVYLTPDRDPVRLIRGWTLVPRQDRARQHDVAEQTE